MSQSRILIVDRDARRARAIQDAISQLSHVTPTIREDGESSVLWLGANECDVCILSYELPGMNGLETLTRMRSRAPELPALMYSEANDQNIAISAFRAGVTDFVPVDGNYVAVIADKVREFIGVPSVPGQAMPSVLEDPTLAHIPRDRLAPSYQNRLRTIGRQLDIYGFHTITILEMSGGFVVRAHRQRSRKPQALEFPDSDFPRLVASALHEEMKDGEKPAQQSELTPTGYEDMLRALGFRLDQRSAEWIVISELEQMIVVTGRGNDEKSSVPGLVQFDLLLKQHDIEFMLNEAFGRRGKLQPKIQTPPSRGGGLRNLLRRIN